MYSDEYTLNRLKAQLSVLIDVQKEYPYRTIENIIAQINSRIKAIENE